MRRLPNQKKRGTLFLLSVPLLKDKGKFILGAFKIRDKSISNSF
jgi:hypothetical protein